MRNKMLFIGLVLTATLSAQTYRLNDMSTETFANGGDAQWSFEKYTYETGAYSKLSLYTDKSTCNYLDIYQPERVGGQLITEIDGVEPAGEFTWASNVRWAWCDLEFTSDVRNNSLERFIYVAQDPREGFGYEVIGNNVYTSVITFTVPEDGYYKVDGTVIREDGDTWIASLDIVPRFRYAFDEQDKGAHMGLAFNYGAVSGVHPDYDGTSGNLAGGAMQKFVAQDPTDFTMAFSAKAGDKVSFEVNTAKMNGHGGDWGHGWWSRTFYRNLTVEKVDAATAQAVEGYVDAYGKAEVEKLWTVLDEYETLSFDMNIGTEFGEYGAEEYDALMVLISEIVDLSDNEKLYDLNYKIYLDRLNEAWRLFKLSQIVIDYNCEGNYLLIFTNKEGVVTVDQSAMSSNTSEPWEFCWYDVNAGVYNLFANHDFKSKFGSDSIAAWYKGTGDWLYITDDGNIHPTTAYAPAYVFVAPEAGVYKFEFACYRPNPNPKVENPLWIRSRFLKAGVTNISKEEFIFAKEYGSVANDGQGGKAPISMNLYVNMQKGDRVTFEEDCYTANRNSSAGTQVTRLAACSRAHEDSIFTVQGVKAWGLEVYDPYGTGDPTELMEAIAYATSIMEEYADSVGVDGGQYSLAVFSTLGDYITEATAIAEAANSTQPIYDRWSTDLYSLVEKFLNSRVPYEIIITGNYKINLIGTEMYITQKNSAGNHFYAAVADSAAIVADAEKNSVDLSVYKQKFTFTQLEGSSATVITSEDGYMTLDGYVLPGADTTAVHTFTFYKYNLEDEACCIKRSDNLYWTGAYDWKAPYNKIKTTDTPAYIFRFENTEDTGIVNPENSGVVLTTEYFTLSGTRTLSPEKGIVIRRRTLVNGTTIVDKWFVR
ncbi:MAG: hypothetical protein E7091_10510 [Bacteroidales bacterium]|nr:hypothetical protein [Bacteroidales bacterium]